MGPKEGIALDSIGFFVCIYHGKCILKCAFTMVNTKNREFAFPMVNAVFFNLHLPWFMHGCFGFVFAMVNTSNFCTKIKTAAARPGVPLDRGFNNKTHKPSFGM